ncbi:LysR family transcriptional regulator ArgP [Tropicimonas aquimaris]|uniref:LysR family transcriptional regulator ArgP n=1 Tax=Tropicimonas aquimaris TaxID=914152 RepID=A0ABW3IYB3_9RHOB
MLTIDTAQLAALAEVIRTGSFDRAAAVLGVTPSAISQRIRALEERQGAVLIRRGQPCTGTEAGMRLFRHAEEVALLEHALERDLGGGTPASRQTIRIAVNADSLATWFPNALAAAQAVDSGLLFDLILDDQDHSADWLRRGEVVAAVTAHASPIQGCDSHPLGALRYLATASPDFMSAHFPQGVTREALAEAPALTFDRKDALQARWISMKAGDGIVPPTHFLPASQAFVDAALLGIGWGMNPEPLARPLIAAGKLVALDPDLPLETPLHWQTSRVARAALAPLSAAVRQVAREWLEPCAA